MSALLHEILNELDSVTLAYLEGVLEEAGEASEVLAPYFVDLDILPGDQTRLCAALAPDSHESGRDITHAREIPGQSMREMWGETGIDDSHAHSKDCSLERFVEQSNSKHCVVACAGAACVWLSGEVEHVHGQITLPQWAVRLFQGAWKQELHAWPRKLSPKQLATLASSLSESVNDKVAEMLFTNDIDGSLCMAGGSDLLIERLVNVSRRSLEACKFICRQLVTLLIKADVDRSPYLDLLTATGHSKMLASFR